MSSWLTAILGIIVGVMPLVIEGTALTWVEMVLGLIIVGGALMDVQKEYKRPSA